MLTIKYAWWNDRFCFVLQLRKPILYLITLTNRSSLTDLTEDIFAYVRERYFVGETLEYNSFGDQW